MERLMDAHRVMNAINGMPGTAVKSDPEASDDQLQLPS